MLKNDLNYVVYHQNGGNKILNHSVLTFECTVYIWHGRGHITWIMIYSSLCMLYAYCMTKSKCYNIVIILCYLYYFIEKSLLRYVNIPRNGTMTITEPRSLYIVHYHEMYCNMSLYRSWRQLDVHLITQKHLIPLGRAVNVQLCGTQWACYTPK